MPTTMPRRGACLSAALNTATGQVTDACSPRHRHQEFLNPSPRPPPPDDADEILTSSNRAKTKTNSPRPALYRLSTLHVSTAPTYSLSIERAVIPSLPRACDGR